MTDILQQQLKASPDAFASAVGDETVLLQVKRGTYFGLDAIGTRIWAGLNEGRTPMEICKQIAVDHDVPIETVEADARVFLEDLKANEIVIPD